MCVSKKTCPTVANYHCVKGLNGIVFKVLRSQRWEKKKETSAAYEVKEDTDPEARVSPRSKADFVTSSREWMVHYSMEKLSSFFSAEQLEAKTAPLLCLVICPSSAFELHPFS